jgi:hypothetical protein
VGAGAGIVLFCDPGSVTLVGRNESWFGDEEEGEYRVELLVSEVRRGGRRRAGRQSWSSSSVIRAC